jgi:hypothetical protein
MRVVKPALVNNRNQENEIKKVSSTPHLLIATEISELRPVLLALMCPILGSLRPLAGAQRSNVGCNAVRPPFTTIAYN